MRSLVGIWREGYGHTDTAVMRQLVVRVRGHGDLVTADGIKKYRNTCSSQYHDLLLLLLRKTSTNLCIRVRQQLTSTPTAERAAVTSSLVGLALPPSTRSM